MFIRCLPIIGLLVLPFNISCTKVIKIVTYGKKSCQKIEIGPGLEDFDYDKANNRLIVSSHERRKWLPTGDIYGVGTKDYKVIKFKRINEPKHFRLRPHGISLVKKDNGQKWLYVISHGQTHEDTQHEIVVYELKGNQLHFLKSLQDTLIHSPNDVFALSSGEIFVTNDMQTRGSTIELLFKLKRGTLAYYNRKNWSIIKKDIGFPNGIYVTKKYIFLTATIEDLLYQYERQPDQSVRLIHKYPISIPDNILSLDQENLIIAAHTSSFSFFRHWKDSSVLSPSLVYHINTKSHNAKIIYANSGEEISAASTAIEIKNRLYISQVFENFLLVCE